MLEAGYQPDFPAEGMVIREAHGIDVGDALRVRLASVNVAKGFIDFERT
jgi:hypothetical protein